MQGSVEYQTLFTVLQKPAPSLLEFYIIPAFFILAGVLGGAATMIRRRAFHDRLKLYLRLAMCAFFLLVGVYVFFVLSSLESNLRDRHDRAKNAYVAGQYSVVEGTVANFHPMPASGHDYETFSVNRVQFAFSDFDDVPCFNNTASHGGPIHEGLRVRIAYSGNCILRLEVAADR